MSSRLSTGILMLAFLSSCATSRGFNRGALREELGDKTVVTDQEIQKTLMLRPQLPRPFKVGVFFKDPGTSEHLDGSKWNWSDEDKQKILSLANQLKASNEVSEVIPISPATITGTDLKSMRLAAAQYGADAVLVVSGVKDKDQFTNGWGWTYIALVTALFVPASEVDILFLSRAAMWDVRNQYLYMTAEAEGLQQQTRPAAFTDERELTERAKADSMNKLRDEIAKMMQGLKDGKHG